MTYEEAIEKANKLVLMQFTYLDNGIRYFVKWEHNFNQWSNPVILVEL